MSKRIGNHLSASSIASWKACPTRYRLAYVEGLRPDKDTEAQRVGTNWHSMHEVWANTGSDADAKMAAVVAHLNDRYKDVPNWITPHEWALERMILLVSFTAYQWYWTNDPVEFLASEVPFNLPVHMPKSGMPLPMDQVQRVGKIDHLIRWQGMVGVLERKSTSRSIEEGGEYWERGQKDTQVSMYAAALRDMAASGMLPAGIETGERFGNTLYDVYHRPTIKPAFLTQADTKALIETGDYHGQQFAVVTHPEPYRLKEGEEGVGANILVDDDLAECKPGKKGFAIKETVGMYGARLLADMYERPAFYFARKEMVRTDAEIAKFRGELFAIYQTQKLVEKHGCWYENEASCRATFKCQYIPICFNQGADAVCDGVTTPAGFKRLFVDLTIEGQAVGAEE